MGHNVSQHKRRNMVLGSPATAFTAWHLHMECTGRECPKGRHVAVQALLRGEDDLATVGHLVSRLRCSCCRQVPTIVEVVERLPEQQGRAIRLTGPGAY